MKKIITIVVIVLIIALLAIPKLNLFNKQQSAKGNIGAGPPGSEASLPVEAVVIQQKSFDRKLLITGSILPSESIELRSEVSGKITRILFNESQAVKKKQLLVKINDDELRAQLEKQLNNRKLNQDNEFRQRKLLEKEAISQEEYDNALNRLNTTMADVKMLEAQIAKTSILAPFDGFVGFRYVSEGAYISPAVIIATIYSLDPAKIEFSIPARYATKVAVKNRIIFHQENTGSKEFIGEVYALEPQIDPNTRTLKIRAKTPNPKGLLIPGQFVSVELILEHLDNAIMIPTEAIIPIQDGAKVYVAHQGKAKEVMVMTGDRTERELEILSGLQAGDTIITSGILQMRQGLKINVTKFLN